MVAVTRPPAAPAPPPDTIAPRAGAGWQRIAAWFDAYADQRAAWRARNRYYYQEIERLARETIPPGARVLEVGCGIGDLLAAVRPAFGVGVDVSERMLEVARRRHAGCGQQAASAPPVARAPRAPRPSGELETDQRAERSGRLLFVRGDAHHLPFRTTFDYVICSDLLGHLDDIQLALDALQAVCTPATKIVITYWNFTWQGVMWLAEWAGWKMPQGPLNWLGMADVDNLLRLADFRTLERGLRLMLPKPVPVLAPLLNRVAVRGPAIRHLSLVTYWIVQPAPPGPAAEALTCSVIVPCRNEAGNVAACVERLPPLGTHTEVIFVDGASTDGTRARILDEIARHAGRRDIRLVDQVPGAGAAPGAAGDEGQATSDTGASPEAPPVKMLRLGKGDAVRKGFAAATGDVLFILDADLTVPPEELPKFLDPIARGKADFVNGTRLVYPLEDEAMGFHRLLGNRFFSLVFTWLLGQPIKDTLCGTKVLRKRDYELIAANRAHFGDFDPFGDFDLLFGAARLGLRIVEVPIRYRRRTYGHTKVNVVEHGPLLLRMSLIGFRRLKLARWRNQALSWLSRLVPLGRAAAPAARPPVGGHRSGTPAEA